MVTVDLIGRLGNQMFQIAACAAHAWRIGQDFRIPTRSLNTTIWPSYFDFGERSAKYNAPNIWREPSHAFTQIPPNLKDVKLIGYFQSEKYFKEYIDEIIKLFDIKRITSTNKCSIHIRLGDYTQMQDKHPVISFDYLSRAIEKVGLITGIRKFIIFSDDVFGAKKIIQRLENGDDQYEFHENILGPKMDMALMSGCAHQICANSSYSWWAAWLNPNPDKIVVMPRVWFGPGNSHLETKDIYPEGAIIL